MKDTVTSVVERELEKILAKHGQLNPEDVVKEASKPAHPLHDRFEWDDTVAGHLYRVLQASELIRHVRVRYPTEGEESVEIRKYFAKRDLGEAGGGYRALEDVQTDPAALDHLERCMQREHKELERRYKHLQIWRKMHP